LVRPDYKDWACWGLCILKGESTMDDYNKDEAEKLLHERVTKESEVDLDNGTSYSKEDVIVRMEQEQNLWKKKHPVQNWIDELFKHKSLADYSASYAVFHPWVFIPFAIRHVRWAWQRVFRGWDDRVIWSIDFHLADMIPVWMRELKKDKQGTPMMMFDEADLQDPNGNISDEASKKAREKFEAILEKIAVGFEAYAKMEDIMVTSDPQYKLEEEKLNEAFDLLKEHFGSLWD